MVLKEIWKFLDLWNYFKYLVTLNEKYTFDDLPDEGHKCRFLIPYGETGYVDKKKKRKSHELSVVYQCKCGELAEINK